MKDRAFYVETSPPYPERYAYGKSYDEVMKNLKNEGFTDILVEDTAEWNGD
jgi:predicted RNase H-like HicB family nuclease